MNPAVRRRLPWAVAALIAVVGVSFFMRSQASFLAGVLAGLVVVALVAYFAGAFRESSDRSAAS